jgi:microcystin-dependent protein
MITNARLEKHAKFFKPLRSGLIAVVILILGLQVNNFLVQSQVRAGVEPPIGTVTAFAGPLDKIPGNWLVCDGRKLSRSDARYRSLFFAIGDTWGGDATSFYLPDFSGRFLRGVDKDGRGTPSDPARDPDRDGRSAAQPNAENPGNAGNEVGSLQLDALQNHKHLESGHTHAANVEVKHDPIAQYDGEEVQSGRGARVNGSDGNAFFRVNVTVRNQVGTANIGDPSESNAGAPRVGGDTRPKNAYVYWIIKYR